jgi:hypothetical protein
MPIDLSSGRRLEFRWSIVPVLLWTVLLWFDLGAAASRPPRTASLDLVAKTGRDAGVPDASAPTAEVTFAAPQYFALLSEPKAKRRLYGKGDLIPDGRGADRGFVVEGIDPTGFRVREMRTQKSFRVAVGAPLPGEGRLLLTETVLLDGVTYHYVTVKERLDLEPRVLQIRGQRAWVEVRSTLSQPVVTAAPARAARPTRPEEHVLQTENRLDATVLGKVRVHETGRDAYQISAADVRMAMNHAERVLLEAWSSVRPMLSWDNGVNFRVQSAVADGVLGPRGFKVTSPNLAERAGIAMGDVILAVNDQPINGFTDLFRLYRQVKADPRLSVVQLRLERQGELVTKTYRIR